MPGRRVGHLAPFVAAVMATFLAATVPAAAQDVTGPALKAAFIHSFAKFTAWPADAVPPGRPLVMCVVGDMAVGDALERVVKDRMLDGHRVTVAYLALTEAQQMCHVLYVSGVTVNQAARLVARLGVMSVLTMSDLEGFIDAGGVAQLFVDQGQLRFSVHTASATRARLQISSRLLALARRK